MTSTEERIIYYYRNGFKNKDIAKKTGLTLNQVRWKLVTIKKKREIKRWWDE